MKSSQQQQQHPYNGLFCRTTWVSWYQKGRTIARVTNNFD